MAVYSIIQIKGKLVWRYLTKYLIVVFDIINASN